MGVGKSLSVIFSKLFLSKWSEGGGGWVACTILEYPSHILCRIGLNLTPKRLTIKCPSSFDYGRKIHTHQILLFPLPPSPSSSLLPPAKSSSFFKSTSHTATPATTTTLPSVLRLTGLLLRPPHHIPPHAPLLVIIVYLNVNRDANLRSPDLA